MNAGKAQLVKEPPGSQNSEKQQEKDLRFGFYALAAPDLLDVEPVIDCSEDTHCDQGE